MKRILRVLGLVLVAILIISGLRWRTDLSEESFWAGKILDDQKYDVGLLGDSRVFRGVLPSVLGQGGSEVINLGFSGVAWTKDYFKFARKRLKEDGVYFFGLTPHSFSSKAASMNGFLDWSNRKKKDLWIDFHLGSWVSLFRSVRLDEVYAYFLGEVTEKKYTYRRDGSVVGEEKPYSLVRTLRAYETQFKDNPLSDEILQSFLHELSQLTSSGHRVFGFFPPVDSQLGQLEKDRLGWKPEKMKAEFVAHGGTWLEPQGSYVLSDGSHLSPEGALQFSIDLLEEWRKH